MFTHMMLNSHFPQLSIGEAVGKKSVAESAISGRLPTDSELLREAQGIRRRRTRGGCISFGTFL